MLLTTRAQALGRLASRIEIEPLDLDTAPLLLLRRAGLLARDAPLAQAEPGEWQAAVQLAQELGGLPLALDQAGAYLEETRCGLSQYLELYRRHRTGLLRHRGGVDPDHPEPVATTWLKYASNSVPEKIPTTSRVNVANAELSFCRRYQRASRSSQERSANFAMALRYTVSTSWPKPFCSR